MTVAAMRYVLSRIAEALGCSSDEDEDLVEAATRLVAERDEARAEIERLRGDAGLNHWLRRLMRERDEARAEVKRLRDLIRRSTSEVGTP